MRFPKFVSQATLPPRTGQLKLRNERVEDSAIVHVSGPSTFVARRVGPPRGVCELGRQWTRVPDPLNALESSPSSATTRSFDRAGTVRPTRGVCSCNHAPGVGVRSIPLGAQPPSIEVCSHDLQHRGFKYPRV